ncbi:hypothetical protein ColLi_09105 [Colletotrichum liriopes]|uniref:Uncharacterized protein n=1 Tax=Colletotrichum liriopes TaxID=708192 RepID=A0AA37GTK8_9PEZI|nr:hypothetical protein ColLi_09105 [Colletotrichum liriopes]
MAPVKFTVDDVKDTAEKVYTLGGVVVCLGSGSGGYRRIRSLLKRIKAGQYKKNDGELSAAVGASFCSLVSLCRRQHTSQT